MVQILRGKLIGCLEKNLKIKNVYSRGLKCLLLLLFWKISVFWIVVEIVFF